MSVGTNATVQIGEWLGFVIGTTRFVFKIPEQTLKNSMLHIIIIIE